MANVEFGKPRFQTPVMNEENISEVTAVYFAKRILTPVYENTEEIIVAKKGENKKKIKARFVTEHKIKKEDLIDYDPETAFEKAKGEEKVTITYKKKVRDSISFKKITKAKIKEKVWVVATCNGTTGKLSIEINENKLTNAETVYDNPVKFLIGEEEKTKIEFEIYKDIIVTPNTYAKEITLQPKSKEDVKALIDKFDKRTDKNAFLYFKAENADAAYELKIFEVNKEFINKDGERLEVKYCNCGEKYQETVECTRYGSIYGPVYWGELPLKDFPKWDDLIKNNSITTDEKSILIAMSENEGKLDSIQSYDSEILTAGAMQKTINPEGYGELPIQFWEFKKNYPEKYILYLENCNWKVEEEKKEKKDKKGIVISTNYKYKAKYKDLSGKELKDKIREGFEKNKFKTKVNCEPIEPIIRLMKDSDYQIIQIKDFIKRLNSSLDKKPTGYSLKISAFVSSNLGKALVLDNDVNRPGQVDDCFGEALDSFFKKNPKVSKIPSEWGTNFSTYEDEILEIYGPLRGEGSYTMTSATKRYNDLKSKL
ncbi:hypothetical protein [Flavobacterium flavigenum]|uniref:hypothetical protein n=1 Tax=Flavobacterium flavigenum TaxID=3003258 RepID=UPI0024825D50|nr:hypothetical protein [Flavobacterium flavigenum]